MQVVGDDAGNDAATRDGAIADAPTVDANTLDADLTSPACTLRLSAVAWWRGEEDVFMDNGVQDSVGAHHGTLENGAGYDSNGEVGQAFSLDGVDDFIQIPDPTEDFLPSGSFSIEFWMRTPETENLAVLVSKDVCVGLVDCQGKNSWWSVSLHSQRIIRFWFNNSDTNTGSQVQVSKSDPGFADGEFHHIIAVRRLGIRDSNKLDLYVYGEQVSATAQSFPGQMHSDIQENAPVTIGAPTRFLSGAESFGGQIDEVVYYDRALNQAEVTTLYENGCPY